MGGLSTNNNEREQTRESKKGIWSEKGASSSLCFPCKQFPNSIHALAIATFQGPVMQKKRCAMVSMQDRGEIEGGKNQIVNESKRGRVKMKVGNK